MDEFIPVDAWIHQVAIPPVICPDCGAWIQPERKDQHRQFHEALTCNGADKPWHEDYSEG